MKAGDKVICVDDAPSAVTGRMVPLVLGAMYTVLHPAPGNGVVLAEVRAIGHPVYGFLSHRFRPLSELEAQIHRIESEGCPAEQEEPVLT